METQLIKITEENKKESIALAAKLILDGEIVGMPTETVYGLGANVYNEDAIKNIFTVKGRPQDNPLIVHISDLIMLKTVIKEITPDAALLAKTFWPGPLTIVLPKTDMVTDTITCGLKTVAVRMPSHPIALALIAKSGVPIAAPSANISGLPSTTTAQHVYEDMHGKIPLILDGGCCDVGVESTVISLSGDCPTVLRPGMINLDQIRAVLPNAVMADGAMNTVADDVQVESPGMKYKHYSPKADVVIVVGTLNQFVKFTKGVAACDSYAMCFDGEEEQIEIPCVAYGNSEDSCSQARRLFSVLRAIDRFNASSIYVRMDYTTDKKSAVYNRLIRAAGNKVVEL